MFYAIDVVMSDYAMLLFQAGSASSLGHQDRRLNKQEPALFRFALRRHGCCVTQAADLARQHFKDSPNVTVVDDVPIDDGWTRDWGPSVRRISCFPCIVGILAQCNRLKAGTCSERLGSLCLMPWQPALPNAGCRANRASLVRRPEQLLHMMSHHFQRHRCVDRSALPRRRAASGLWQACTGTTTAMVRCALRSASVRCCAVPTGHQWTCSFSVLMPQYADLPKASRFRKGSAECMASLSVIRRHAEEAVGGAHHDAELGPRC